VIALQARGGRGVLYWLLDGELVARSGSGEIRLLQLRHTGRRHLTVMDEAGNFDAVAFTVEKGFVQK
jgi:membrane carboxypeptidase/penicillin-binding protein PbpC